MTSVTALRGHHEMEWPCGQLMQMLHHQAASREPLAERRTEPVTGIRQHTAEAHTGRHHAIDLSLVSLVPFISSRIQTGVMPLPDHFSDLSFLLLILRFRLGPFAGTAIRSTEAANYGAIPDRVAIRDRCFARYSGRIATLRNLITPEPCCSVNGPSTNRPLCSSTVF